MFEKGTNVIEPILPNEEQAYGISLQKIATGGIWIQMRALPNRWIFFKTWHSGTSCASIATMKISDAQASVFNIHIVLKWPFGIDHLLVRGYNLFDSHLVEENILP
jgi:hypothetical protein